MVSVKVASTLTFNHMARLKLSGLVSDISGSIGGTTFQRNAFGISMRTKPVRGQHSSASQIRTRQYMAQCLSAWNLLTTEQRATWDQGIVFFQTRAKHNKSSLLNGRSLYLQWNMTRLLSGLALTNTFSYFLPEWTDFVIQIKESSNSNYLHITPDLEANDFGILTKFSRPLNEGESAVRTSTRVCRCIYSSPGYYYFDIDYVAHYGVNLEPADYVDMYYRVFSQSAPYIFGEVKVNCLVTAL